MQITSFHWRHGHLSVGCLMRKARDEGLPSLATLISKSAGAPFTDGRVVDRETRLRAQPGAS